MRSVSLAGVLLSVLAVLAPAAAQDSAEETVRDCLKRLAQGKTDRKERKQLKRSLLKAGKGAGERPLAKAWQRLKTPEAVFVLDLLVDWKSRYALSALVRASQDRRLEVRIEAADQLHRYTRSAHARKALVKLLKDDNIRVVRPALSAVEESRLQEGWAPLLERIATSQLEVSDMEVVLLEGAQPDDMGEEGRGEFPHEEATAVLAALFRDRPSRERIDQVLEAMGQAASQGARLLMFCALAQSGNEEVATILGVLLEEALTPEGGDLPERPLDLDPIFQEQGLITHLRPYSDAVCAHAARGLGIARSLSHHDLLLRAARQRARPWLQVSAADALADTASNHAQRLDVLRLYVDLLSDRNPIVSRRVHKLLKEVTGQDLPLSVPRWNKWYVSYQKRSEREVVAAFLLKDGWEDVDAFLKENGYQDLAAYLRDGGQERLEEYLNEHEGFQRGARRKRSEGERSERERSERD